MEKLRRIAERDPWLLLLFSSSLVGIAAWIEGAWFVIAVALFPLFFVVDSLPMRRAFWWIIFFVCTTGVVLALPLLSLRSIQSLPLDDAQYYIVFLVMLGYVFSLSLLGTLVFLLPLVFFKKWRAILFPLAWIGFEFVRAKLSFGLTWIMAGELLVDFLPLGIFARIGGVYLLSFIVMASSILLYECIVHVANKKYILPALSAVFLALLVSSGYLYARGIKKDFTQSPKELIRVALVQPGSVGSRIPPEYYYTALWKKTRETVQEAKIKPVDLLILPGNFWGKITREELNTKDLARDILGFSPKVRAYVLGLSLSENGEKYQANALVTSGATEVTFKEFLFPLADYVPQFLKRIGVQTPAPEYSTRKNVPVSLSENISFGILSCSEEFNPGLFGRLKNEGAKFMVISGSNSDFASDLAYYETQRTARLRALENGVYVIQALKNGISAIIDPFGRLTASLDKDQVGILTGDVLVRTK